MQTCTWLSDRVKIKGLLEANILIWVYIVCQSLFSVNLNLNGFILFSKGTVKISKSADGNEIRLQLVLLIFCVNMN